jgi:inosose dehydratase
MNTGLATGPVSWGVDFADHPDNPPWQRVLDETAAAGYRFTELGPLGYLPEDPDALAAELASRGLAVAGSGIFEPLHDGEQFARVLDVARRTCRLVAGAGGRHLVIIDRVSPEREATAGRAGVAPRLSASEWGVLVNAVERVALLAFDEFGLEPAFHPHVGSYVEFEDEIEALLEALDGDLITLCLDTGHGAYAGVDPIELYRRYTERVSYLHLKDVNDAVRSRVVDEGLDFWTAINAGIFCPLGAGTVDFEALARELRRRDFQGPATVEQDRDPGDPSPPVEDLIRSREFLERVGICEPAGEATL